MKKLLILGLLMGCGLFYSSCDNELELITDWKDIPIVYGIVNANDTAHYIRVEKAFIDPAISALELAQIPDSLYYENIQVQIRNMSTEETFNMTRVDGTTEGYPRDSGVFASAPNYLYKLKLPEDKKFGDGNVLELVLNRGDNTELVRAQAPVVSNFIVNSPKVETNPNLRMTKKYNVSWRLPAEGTVFDFAFILHYQEKLLNEAEWVDKTLTWSLARNIEPGFGDASYSQNIPAGEFYRFLSSNIDVVPDMVRRFQTIDIQIDAGGAELKKYLDQGKVNTGLTSSQVIPTYTNLSEGFGIFSSRVTIVTEGYTLEAESRDSLRNSELTAPLQFQ